MSKIKLLLDVVSDMRSLAAVSYTHLDVYKRQALRSVVWVKYKIKDKEVFDKAYKYIEEYY